MEEATPAFAEGLAAPATETQAPEAVQKDEPIDLDAPEEVTADADAEPVLDEEGEEPAAEDGEGEGDASNDAPDLVEIELDGEKYLVPEKLKDGYLRQADYTRKTQEVAEVRKTAEAIKAEAETQFNVSTEVLQARATLLNIDSQLQEYQALNWDQMEAEDPIGAQSAWRRFQSLKEQRGQYATYLDQQQHQRAEQMQRETAKRLRETAEFAQKNIPGWSPELDNKITDFAVERGFTRESLAEALTPQVYEVLHLAYLGQQSLSKQQTAPRPAPPTQPLRTVSAKASPVVTKNPENMSMDEYVAYRNAQMRKR